MATVAGIMTRVRTMLGEEQEPFRQTYRGSGWQTEWDLPASKIIPTSVQAFVTYPETLQNTNLIASTDFTLDADNGILTTTVPVQKDWMLTVQGNNAGLFSDAELSQYIADALSLHLSNADANSIRYRDGRGFISYEITQKSLSNLPPAEEVPLTYLSVIQCLYALLLDASLDIDIITSEGTHIPRGQRFSQLQNMIALMQNKYEEYCLILGVGMYKVQVSTLRRVSRQNNRLVAVFEDREYDDMTLPIRILPAIARRDSDPDGPPSPLNNYWGVY